MTVVSAVMTCTGGTLYAQYQLYVNPDTVSGIAFSLQMVFGVIAGGMFVMLGPDRRRRVHAAARRGPARSCSATTYPGVDTTIYGAACWCCSSSSCRKASWARCST